MVWKYSSFYSFFFGLPSENISSEFGWADYKAPQKDTRRRSFPVTVSLPALETPVTGTLSKEEASALIAAHWFLTVTPQIVRIRRTRKQLRSQADTDIVRRPAGPHSGRVMEGWLAGCKKKKKSISCIDTSQKTGRWESSECYLINCSLFKWSTPKKCDLSALTAIYTD